MSKIFLAQIIRAYGNAAPGLMAQHLEQSLQQFIAQPHNLSRNEVISPFPGQPKNRQKLSKSHGATGVPLDRTELTLHKALAMLGQEPPRQLGASSLPEIWAWAHANWNIDVLNGRTEILPETGAMA